jgi:hypothetical protein
MSDVQANVSLGREVELYQRVLDDDPVGCGLVMLVLTTAGLPSDAALKDYDTVEDLFFGGANEVTNSGYVRPAFLTGDLDPYVVDDTNNIIILTLPVATFVNVAVGDHWRKVVIAFDPDTTGGSSGSNTELIPISYHDLLDEDGVEIVPNTFNIEIDFSAGFIIAS